MFGLLYFLRNIALRYAQKRNCLFLTSTFLTSETRPAQVSGTTICHVPKKQYLCSVIQVVSYAHDSVRIKSQVSPKWVPSKSHFLADKDGRKEGRRRIQKDSAGFRRIQKNSEDTYYSNGLWPINKIFNIGLSYPMGGNSVETFEGNLRFLEEAAIVTSSW